jgi:hypothetical protein
MELRMFAMKKSIQTILLAAAIASIGGSTVHAQCLLDIFGLGKPAATTPTNPYAVPGYPYAANYPAMTANYPVQGQGLQGQPLTGGLPYSAGYAGLPQSAVSLASPTNYNTSYFPVPTTYYRPVVTTDPRTGQQVTTMMPCTSYQMQAARTPAWSIGQWLHGGNQTPMVPAAPLPTATSSPGIMPPGSNPSAVTSTYTNAADPNSVPTLPAINPSLPIYGTQVQAGYGNPLSYSVPAVSNPAASVNNQPSLNGYSNAYNNGVVTANYMSAPALNSYPNSQPVPTYNSTTGIYPPDLNLPAASTNSWNNSSSSNVPSLTLPAEAATATPGIYPPVPNDSQFSPPPMYSAEPEPGKTSAPSDPAAIERPVLPPDDSTSQVDRGSTSNSLSDPSNQGRIQSVVRQPSAETREMSTKSIEQVRNSVVNERPTPLTTQPVAPPATEKARATGNDKGSLSPALKPIPLPEGFDSEPQWNPSLLNSSDKTASIPSLENTSPNAQPKPAPTDDVRWASFSDPVRNETNRPSVSRIDANVESGRRPAPVSLQKSGSKSRYSTDGWKSAK